jgi:hypothetical protein
LLQRLDVRALANELGRQHDFKWLGRQDESQAPSQGCLF